LVAKEMMTAEELVFCMILNIHFNFSKGGPLPPRKIEMIYIVSSSSAVVLTLRTKWSELVVAYISVE